MAGPLEVEHGGLGPMLGLHPAEPAAFLSPRRLRCDPALSDETDLDVDLDVVLHDHDHALGAVCFALAGIRRAGRSLGGT